MFKLLLCAALAASALPGALGDNAKSKIDQVTGVKGVYTGSEDVHKVSFPRTDVKVTVDRYQMSPFMGLTSWAAFTSGHQYEALVMGDLVLFEDEVNPVMSVALDNGLEVTALHNHFFFDSPRVMFMHIGGEASADALARAVRKCLDKVKQIRGAFPTPVMQFGGADIPVPSSITATVLDNVFGSSGQSNNGMYKAVIGQTARMHGRPVGSQMGVNTWAAFAGSDDAAFVDGDFAMHPVELQAVLKSLRGAGIHVVAIHNHMTNEEPQFVFLHYWGKGKAAFLAKAIKAALEKQSAASSSRLTHPH
ncbi:MAG TPA: DUF1259 domain-containing protein [Bryobacteraceae bacterium]|nr:DUF1259 domain-containing protein [Bryobacteraceae bacterium]